MAALNICNLMLHKDWNKSVKLVTSQIPNIHYVLLYQLMHLLQVTLKSLKTPFLKNNPTCFDLSRSSSGIHFLVELLLFSL